MVLNLGLYFDVVKVEESNWVCFENILYMLDNNNQRLVLAAHDWVGIQTVKYQQQIKKAIQLWLQCKL